MLLSFTTLLRNASYISQITTPKDTLVCSFSSELLALKCFLKLYFLLIQIFLATNFITNSSVSSISSITRPFRLGTRHSFPAPQLWLSILPLARLSKYSISSLWECKLAQQAWLYYKELSLSSQCISGGSVHSSSQIFPECLLWAQHSVRC